MRRLTDSLVVAFVVLLTSGPGPAPGPGDATAAGPSSANRPARRAGPVAARKGRGKNRRRARAPAPVPALTSAGLPNVQAAAAVVVDLDAGDELFAKHPDAVRHIASVGKLVVALAVRDKGLPLDGQTTITAEDRRYARGGARSRLHEGKAFRNHDLLRAMLISSDNRAVTALGRAAGLAPDALVAAMNEQAQQLGLRRTRFTEPVGLDGNVSTPRELIIVLKAALADPVIAEIIATPTAIVRSTSDPNYQVQYFNTNVSLRAGQYPVLGGKTGFTDEAKYCLAIAATLGGHRVGMVFLGAEGELTRFADFKRVADWITAGGPARTAELRRTSGAGSSFDPPRAVVPRLDP